MSVLKLSTERFLPYWDEGNKNLIPHYKKGKLKRLLRKKFIKVQLKERSKE